MGSIDFGLVYGWDWLWKFSNAPFIKFLKKLLAFLYYLQVAKFCHIHALAFEQRQILHCFI